jgi:hypothetical protein
VDELAIYYCERTRELACINASLRQVLRLVLGTNQELTEEVRLWRTATDDLMTEIGLLEEEKAA